MVTERSEANVPLGVALFCVLGLLVAGSWVGMNLAMAMAARALGLRMGLIAGELALATPGVVLLAWLAARPAAALGLRSLPARGLGLAAVSGVTLWAASLGLMELQSSFWPPPAGYLEQFRRLHELLRPQGVLDGLYSVAAIALAPAVCEELLFRGVVLSSLAARLGPWPALVGSATLFGAIHLDFVAGVHVTLYRVPFALAVGIGLGLLRLRTGSLLASILAHCTLNTLTLVLAPFVDDPMESAQAGNPWVGLGLMAVGVSASWGLLRLLERRAGVPRAPA